MDGSHPGVNHLPLQDTLNGSALVHQYSSHEQREYHADNVRHADYRCSDKGTCERREHQDSRENWGTTRTRDASENPQGEYGGDALSLKIDARVEHRDQLYSEERGRPEEEHEEPTDNEKERVVQADECGKRKDPQGNGEEDGGHSECEDEGHS